MPSLWIVIPLDKLALAALYLERSGFLPLELRASWKYPSWELLFEAMQLARPHWQRWERIVFELTQDKEDNTEAVFKELSRFEDCESLGNSQLRHLTFVLLGHQHESTRDSGVFFPCITSLQRVELSGVALQPLYDVPTGSLSNMKELHIESSPGICSAVRIILLLDATPHLTKLTIKYPGGINDFKPTHFANVQILLESLETLELVDLYPDMSFSLLKAISVPNLRRLVLHSTKFVNYMDHPLLLHAASNYHGLLHLSIFSTHEKASSIVSRWLEDLNELEHLDIRELNEKRLSEAEANAQGILKKLADPSKHICPSLVRLQGSRRWGEVTRGLARDVVKLRSGHNNFRMVVRDSGQYKDFDL